MSMLKKAENKMAYAKIGLYGDAGSGKTYTAALLAIGIHKYGKLTKPVGMFDTEPAASYIIPLFQKAGIEFLVYDESRALKDLMAFMDEAEQACSVVIVDSITHIWRDVQESYLARINETRHNNGKKPITQLEFQDWRPIKSAWGKFTDRYLSSKLHCIVCGRAGSIYEYQQNERTGKKELITIGTKMATEKELGYEPSLLIEMVKRREDGGITNTAIVEKDRAATLNGKEIPNPTFDKFLSHFEALNLGGAGVVMKDRDSREMFDESGDDNWTAEKRQREIWCEEIEGLLTKHYPSRSADDVKAKGDLIEKTFNTRSWTRVQSMKSDDIKYGFEQMKAILEPPVSVMDSDANLDKVMNA